MTYLPDIAGITYGFRCRPALRVGYGGTVALLLVMAVGSTVASAVSKDPRDSTRSHMLDRTRVASCVALCAFGLVPLVHWCCITPASERHELLPSMLTMFTFYGIGFFFFESRLPERLAPGSFDFVPSHCLWHIAIVAGFAAWDDACTRMIQLPWAGPTACAGWQL